MCVSKVQHMTGRKTGCNRYRPFFFGFSIFQQTSQLATEKIQNLCNRNWWSGLLQLGSVRLRSFFQSSELDLQTLLVVVKKEWLDQSGDLITHWWQLIIEERREDQILQQFPSIILLYVSI